MSKSLKEIKSLYTRFGLDEEKVWHKTKILLSIYRKVVWSIKSQSENILCENVATYGRSLDDALAFLYEFAPIEDRDRFESKVQYLFETKWLIDLIDKSLLHVRNYPDKGDVYYQVIYNIFLSEKKVSDTECMEMINVEKTTYYNRKKEAIFLMGIALWGYAIPEIRKEVEELREVHQTKKVFVYAN